MLIYLDAGDSLAPRSDAVYPKIRSNLNTLKRSEEIQITNVACCRAGIIAKRSCGFGVYESIEVG